MPLLPSIETYYGDADKHLDTGMGLVWWVLMDARDTEAYLYIRDGISTSGKILTRISPAQYHTKWVRFDPPLEYVTGLFIDVTSDIKSYTVCYDTTDRPRGV